MKPHKLRSAEFEVPWWSSNPAAVAKSEQVVSETIINSGRQTNEMQPSSVILPLSVMIRKSEDVGSGDDTGPQSPRGSMPHSFATIVPLHFTTSHAFTYPDAQIAGEIVVPRSQP